MLSRENAKWPSLAGFIGGLYGIGYVLNQYFPMDSEWFRALNHPPIQLPTALSGFVWSTVYLLLGYTAWTVFWSAPFARTRTALMSWGLHLAVSFAWAWTVWQHNLTLLPVHAAALLITALFMHREFDSISESASLPLVPYLLWIAFHTFYVSWMYIIN